MTDPARAGVRPWVIQSIAGHKTLAQTLSYIKRTALGQTRQATKVIPFRFPQVTYKPGEDEGRCYATDAEEG